jgi:hypothetical protein
MKYILFTWFYLTLLILFLIYKLNFIYVIWISKKLRRRAIKRTQSHKENEDEDNDDGVDNTIQANKISYIYDSSLARSLFVWVKKRSTRTLHK